MKKICCLIIFISLLYVGGCRNQKDNFIEIQIDQNNFFDYFEVVENEIKQIDDSDFKYEYTWGVVSKMYDKGYYFYSSEPFYIYVKEFGYPNPSKYEILELLSLHSGIQWKQDDDFNPQLPQIIEINPSAKIKYVNKDYIKEISIDKVGDYEVETLILKNGEEIKRIINNNNLY